MFWVNLSYLPIFFFTLFIVFYIFTHKHGFIKLTASLILLLIIYSCELKDFIFLNNFLLVSDFSSHLINTLLTNLLNKYHPLLFYISVIYLLSLTFHHTFFTFKQEKFTSPNPQARLIGNFFTGFQSIFLALFLGS